ncbi:MAG: hypothetical protein ACK452_02405, partial [Bacteroidota bacterium]
FINMKNFILKTSSVVFFLALFYSCAPEEETPTTPVDPKMKWIGTWMCQETTGLNPGTSYTIHITDSVGTDFVKIENLYMSGFQTKVRCSVNSSNMSIPLQLLGGAETINGSGSMVSNTNISLSFSVNDGSVIDNVTASLTKQ